MRKIKLSIVIVNYNTKKLTVDCIKSIRKSRPKIKYEVIVIDNGSVDGSKDVFKKLKRGNIIDKLIVNRNNKGFAKATNQGLKVSKGEYKLLLNSDTVVNKEVLDKIVDFARRNKNAGVIGPKLILKDGSIQESCFNFPTIGNAIREYWFGKPYAYSNFAPKDKIPLAVDAIVGAAFLITPKAYKKIGMLNEKYFMYFEDLDYCREIKKKGMKTYYLPNIKVKHLHGATGKTMRRDEVYKMLHLSSKNYHGKLRHFIIQFILWSGQKLRKKAVT